MKKLSSCICKKLNSTMNKKINGFSLTRVVLACFLIIFQLLAVIVPAGITVKAEDNGVRLVVEEMPNVLPIGEVFAVNVTLHNNTGKAITDIELIIGANEGLMPINATSDRKFLYKNVELPNEQQRSYTIKLVYNGSEDTPIITIGCRCRLEGEEWNQAKNDSDSRIVFFKSDSSGNTPPVTTEKTVPNIKVKSDIKMPAFKAGEDVILSLPVVNDSLYESRNIIAAIDTSNESILPFTFDQIILDSYIDKILSKKEDKISYNIKIKADAKEGIYPIKLNYQYSNIYNNTFSSGETIYIKVINDKTPPKLIMESIQTYGSDPSPGNIMSLALSLKNQGSLPAKDIKVTLKGLGIDGITTYKSADSKYISQIDGQGKGKAEYFLIISEKFTGNSASLKADIEYKDGLGNTYSDEFQFFVRINEIKEEEEDLTKPEIALKDLDFPTGKIQAGDDFNLGFILDSVGTDSAQNVKVSLTCDDGILPKSSSVIQIDALEKGQSKELKFNLFASLSAITKNYLIAINVEYENVTEDKENKKDKIEKLTLTRYVGVYVEKKEEEDEDKDKDKEEKTVPKIIINMYSFEPEEVKAGENFKLKLSFLNTSKILPIRNIKITFSAKEGVFIPTSSSNTFFIEYMGTQGIIEREVELLAKSDAPPKSHVLNLIFDYEDEKGTQYNAAEEISIPVKQEQKLVVGQLNLPVEGYEGQPIPIFVDFFNMGKSVLYNLMVTVEGEGFQTENANYFAGNFEPGRSDYFESMITPSSAGEAAGELVFSFEDEAGSKNEVRKEIKLNIMGMERPTMSPEGAMGEEFPGGMPPQDQQKKLLTPLNIGIAGGGLVVIIVVLIIILRKRRIRKAGMTFDE
ncbi:MAG TPA: hypothetical protein PK733_15980 [Clostridiales bacterium]|nr:hypothetical protein [Clostridiales bacterium]